MSFRPTDVLSSVLEVGFFVSAAVIAAIGAISLR